MLSKTLKENWGFLIVFLLVLIKLSIHFYANSNYGYHRDELLHLSASHHLAWGYMEFPPFIAWLGRLQTLLFGDGLWVTRIFPSLLGTSIVLLAALMAKEMGGKNLAIALAAVGVMGGYSYYRNHTLFQPVAFDQFFWSMASFLVLKYINSEKEKYLWLLGFVVGLGMLNKYTMLYWISGVAVGLLFYKKGILYKKRVFWKVALLFLLMILPNVFWQVENGLPILQHAGALYDGHFQGGFTARINFLMGQFESMNRWSFPIWGGGIVLLLFWKALKKFRLFGIAYLVTLILFLITNGKHYYLFSAYPILFAAGAVGINQLLQSKLQYLVLNYLVLFWSVWIVYDALSEVYYDAPVLPIDEYAIAVGLEKNDEGRWEGMPGDYADMFGWEEQVALVDSIYRSFPTIERRDLTIWAENYGEAGAIEIIGRKYGLPQPVCKHGSFWLWGAGETSGQTVISIGNETDAVNYFFEEVALIKIIKHPYAIDEENGIPVYLCRKPKILLKDYWPKWRDNVFD